MECLDREYAQHKFPIITYEDTQSPLMEKHTIARESYVAGFESRNEEVKKLKTLLQKFDLSITYLTQKAEQGTFRSDSVYKVYLKIKEEINKAL